jgi:S-adenosyl methyltransferase
MPTNDREPVDIDQARPHSARVYDYLLGGDTNFHADRVAAELQVQAIGGLDEARAAVQANRAFQHRALEVLIAHVPYSPVPERIAQVLDIGTGIPSHPTLHRTAHLTAPDVRVVYVDHDPTVLAHAHELRAEQADLTAFIDGDLYELSGIMAEAREYLDFDQPIAVFLAAIMHHVPDAQDPYRLVDRVIEALPLGSALVLSHLPSDIAAEQMKALAAAVPAQAQYTFTMRSHAEVTRFFDRLELIEPGVVPADQWRPHDPNREPYGDTVAGAMWAGVGIKTKA